jgi:hypothetical protein
MRTRERILAVVCAAGLLAASSACDKSPDGPSAPLDMAGTWTGQLGQPGSASALRLTWVAIHSGNVVSGVATIVKPAVNVQGRGVMTGILDGDRLVITYSVPPDTIQGFATCESGGLGNGTATSTSITGTLPLFFRSCGGTGLEPPGSNELRLTR